jgi:hypothetical protein
MAAHSHTGNRDVADAVTNFLLNGLRHRHEYPTPALGLSSEFGVHA